LKGDVDSAGAIVDVLLGLSRPQMQHLRAFLRPVPQPISLRALLDTGADCSCIDSRCATSLGLDLRGFTWANLPASGGLIPAMQYAASLTVIHPSGDPHFHLVVNDLLVIDVSLGRLGYEVVVGRDVLDACRFLYHGPRKRFRLAY
jgi:hypothetical protein